MGGIHSFKVIKKMNVIDMFDEHNIKRMIELADVYIDNIKECDLFKKFLIITSGYHLSFEDQLKYYINGQKKDIKLYTLNENINTYQYCKNEDSNINYIQNISTIKSEHINLNHVREINI
jgi:hypothetical protein